MLARLYDEDKRPSGFAGGLVTKQEKYRMRRLTLTARNDWPGTGRLLGRYTITLDGDGCLREYRRLVRREGVPPGAQVRYAYLEAQNPSDEPQAARRGALRSPEDTQEVSLPWTEDLANLCVR